MVEYVERKTRRGRGCAAGDGATDAPLWVSLAGAGLWRIPRRRRRRGRMDPPAIPMTTGGSCEKPPSAGAWSSRCSPHCHSCSHMCPRFLVAGSKALKSGPRSWQGLRTTLSMEDSGQLWLSKAETWDLFGHQLAALPHPPSTPTSPPVPVHLGSLFTWPLLLRTGRRLSSPWPPPLSFWVTSKSSYFLEMPLPGPWITRAGWVS